MKKLLIATLVLIMTSAGAVQAVNTTYSTPLADKIGAKEKQFQQQQKARQDARAKQQADWQKQQKARQEAQAKQKADFQKKIEADKKARENASKARQQKVEQKKKQLNDLLSK